MLKLKFTEIKIVVVVHQQETCTNALFSIQSSCHWEVLPSTALLPTVLVCNHIPFSVVGLVLNQRQVELMFEQNIQTFFFPFFRYGTQSKRDLIVLVSSNWPVKAIIKLANAS